MVTPIRSRVKPSAWPAIRSIAREGGIVLVRHADGRVERIDSAALETYLALRYGAEYAVKWSKQILGGTAKKFEADLPLSAESASELSDIASQLTSLVDDLPPVLANRVAGVVLALNDMVGSQTEEQMCDRRVASLLSVPIREAAQTLYRFGPTTAQKQQFRSSVLKRLDALLEELEVRGS